MSDIDQQNKIDMNRTDVTLIMPSGKEHKVSTYNGGENWDVVLYIPKNFSFPTFNDLLTKLLEIDRNEQARLTNGE